MIVFKRYLVILFWLLNYSISCAKVLQNNDSLQIAEFNSYATDVAKLDWLLNSKLPSAHSFIKKNQAIYDSFSRKIFRGENELLKYKLNLLDGLMHYHQNHYQKAIPLLLNILNEQKFVNQNDSVNVIITLKVCFGKMLNYPKVVEMHQLLKSIAKRNSKVNELDLGFPLSSVYINMGFLAEGIKALKEEHQAKTNISDRYANANFLNNMGVVWQKWNKPDSAIFYFEKAQLLIKGFLAAEPNNKYCIFFDGLLAGNIGQALMEKKKINEAIPLLKKDIYCSLNTGNLQNAAISYNELAQCYFENKKYQNCEAFLDSALRILNEIDAPQLLLKNIKLRADLYAQTGKSEEANMIYEKYIFLYDSIAAVDKDLLMLNQRIAYQTNELEEKIRLQKNELTARQIFEEKRSSQRTLLLVLLTLLLAILIIGYFSLLKIKKRERELREKNEEITTKNSIIGAALKEKELLVKEVHHRVKNNMQIIISLLKLQAEKIDDKNVEMYFAEAQNRIQSMALIHEFLYKKEKMDFLQIDKYITELTKEIQTSYTQPHHTINLTCDCDEILLDFDTSIPLGLIVNELVTNAYKHAFPDGVGNIWVSLKSIGNNYSLKVRDNGIGIQHDNEAKKENSLGMELIYLLANQINGSVELSHNNGFEVQIIFPKTTT
jgi:two-component sensor histidine kinase